MKTKIGFLFLILLWSSCAKNIDVNGRVINNDTPTIEVVFVLDATGSMTSLIEGAKRKIWSIANQIIIGDPMPNVRIGLVAYRDRGDEYIVKAYNLSEDIDKIYSNLIGITAAGGGDFPEDVNKALEYAVDSMNWSEDNNVLRLVFLVGDAPPHMDYNDERDYIEICKNAISQDIIINTVRCGSDNSTEEVWKEIAHLAEGNYTSIDYSTTQSVETPFDEELSKLSKELYGTVLYYGTEGEREMAAGYMHVAEMAVDEEITTAADRATFASTKASSGGSISETDLLGGIIEGRIELKDISNDLLPAQLVDLSTEEREQYIDSLKNEREEIVKQMTELSKLREQYLKDNTGDVTDAFDVFVIETLKDQADKIGIDYGEE